MRKGDIFVYIDAANMWEVYKSKGRIIDYEKFVRYVKKKYPKAKGIQFYYYEAYPAAETREYDTGKKHNFHTYLKKGLGFSVKKKKLKVIRISDDSGNISKKEKGNMDVEITMDMVMHNHNTQNTVILC